MESSNAWQLTLPDVVAENAARFGSRTALVGEEPGERITYAELPERMHRLANALHDAGVRRGDCVASLAMNSCGAFEALLAASALGASLAPLNWRLSDEELAWALGHAAPAFVLYDPEWEHLAPAASAPYAALDELRAAASPDRPDAQPSEDDAALRLFTAAFTGRPKAADLSQRALLSISVQQIVQHRVGHDEVLLNSGPMFHVGDWIFALPVFHMGGTNVIPRKFDAKQAAALVAREQVTWAYLAPPIGSALLDAAEADGIDLSSIRKGVAFEDRERWYGRTSASPASDVMPYGQTEVSGLATYQVSAPGGPAQSGTTLPLVRMRIVSPDGGDVEPGEVGEIALRGPTVMLGYLADDEANAERYRDGWYRTHDLGRRAPDGGVQFLGPITEIIKSGAENIYPAEVEAALRRHPGVEAVCVIGVPDETWGAAVKAVVAPRADAQLDAADLVEFCKDQIASYKKPRHVEIVETLPMAGPFVDRQRVHELHGEAAEGDITWSGRAKA